MPSRVKTIRRIADALKDLKSDLTVAFLSPNPAEAPKGGGASGHEPAPDHNAKPHQPETAGGAEAPPVKDDGRTDAQYDAAFVDGARAALAAGADPATEQAFRISLWKRAESLRKPCSPPPPTPSPAASARDHPNDR